MTKQQLSESEIGYLRKDALVLYCEIYNLFQSTTIDDILSAFNPKRRLATLSKRRKCALLQVKKIIDKLTGRDTIMVVDDLPLVEMTLERAREASEK